MLGQIFVSYSHSDRGYVDLLAQHLRSAGLAVWYDYRIEAGQRFDFVIQQAIDEAAVVVVVQSAASMASDWVARELHYAVTNGKRLVPLLLGSSSTPLVLSGTHHEDVRGGRMPSFRLVQLLQESSRILLSDGQPSQKYRPIGDANSSAAHAASTPPLPLGGDLASQANIGPPTGGPGSMAELLRELISRRTQLWSGGVSIVPNIPPNHVARVREAFLLEEGEQLVADINPTFRTLGYFAFTDRRLLYIQASEDPFGRQDADRLLSFRYVDIDPKRIGVHKFDVLLGSLNLNSGGPAEDMASLIGAIVRVSRGLPEVP